MQQTVLDFSKKHQLFFNKNTLIVAVSGGVDSMVLLHLLSRLDLKLIVAHCNFCLREKESDLDEIFVKNQVQRLKNENVVFETIHFNTNKYAQENKLSIQEAARNLRYNWFETLRQKYKAQAIATAHHLNDNTETILYNFTKGTGINGLRGMLPKKGNIIRPLLEISKETIRTYANKNQIEYRSDSSNDSLKYNRNLIRKKVVSRVRKNKC